MASIKQDYFLSSHKGKISYDNPGQAKEVADRMNREYREAGSIKRVEVYRCEYCNRHHVGHALDKEKKMKLLASKKKKMWSG